MSRNLPARPNLDHLKGQAKELLADLKRGKPDAQLADALHEIAREYGFDGWPKLKAHVESLAADASPFAGSWIADVARSTRHPVNQFRSARMQVAVTRNTVTTKDIVVTADGKMEETHHTIVADGQPHTTPNGYVLTASLVGRVLETTASKDGEVVGRGRYEVSANGQMLTISTPEQTIVCRRA